MSSPRMVSDIKSGQLIAQWNFAAYFCVGGALLLVLVITGWGAYVDFADVRHAMLQGEVGRLRSQGIHIVAKIQDRMGHAGGSLEKAVHQDNWPRENWNRWIPGDKSRLYAAIVDDTGRIVMHSTPALEGLRLGPHWYERVVPEAGEDVVYTTSRNLAAGKRAYDIHVPILNGDREIGEYHSALAADWFDDELAKTYAAARVRWGFILGSVLAVVVVASISLHNIIRRTLILREEVEMSRVRQFAELGELAAGIAHEIRNPINVVRLNMHVLQRLLQSAAEHDGGEAATVIAESNRAIERMEGLMRVMLGYARPEKAVDEDINVGGELQATLEFLQTVMTRDRITVNLRLPPAPLYVRIDRNRFRQIAIHLLNNAREAAGPCGQVDVEASRCRDRVEIVVADNGRGMPAAQRQRIFDPFHSTRDLGTGLGLSLVKRFVEEAHGTVVCEDNEPSGGRFRIEFPEAAHDGAAHLTAK
jgi:signal transduction histidine kinase